MIDVPRPEREAHGQLRRLRDEAGQRFDSQRQPPQSHPLLPITDQRQRDMEDERDIIARMRAKMIEAKEQSDRYSALVRETGDR